MKKLIIPLVFAVLAGLSGGSGFSYVTAKKSSAAYALHLADSVAKHVKDSTAVARAAEKAELARAKQAAAEAALPLTPADSIRAAQNEPTTLKAATQGLANAVDPKHTTPPADGTVTKVAARPSTLTPSPAASRAPAVPPKASNTKVVSPPPVATVPAPRPTPPTTAAPVESVLPESRIAKIFSAMQSKDAAKVLEQMNDNDIRTILGMMGDKQAAAILTAFPPQRAAAISKGDKKPTGGKS